MKQGPPRSEYQGYDDVMDEIRTIAEATKRGEDPP